MGPTLHSYRRLALYDPLDTEESKMWVGPIWDDSPQSDETLRDIVVEYNRKTAKEKRSTMVVGVFDFRPGNDEEPEP